MSTPQSEGLYCIAQTADRILNGFLRVADSWHKDGNTRISVETNIDGLSVNGNYKPASADINTFQKFLTETSNHPTIICRSATISFWPTGLDQNAWNQQRINSYSIRYETDNGVVGRFIVSLSQITDFIPVALKDLEECFPITSYIDLARTESPSIDETALQLRERSVADLKEQVAKLAEFLTGMAEREAIYYLKWNDRWFREHADAEFAAKRYKADILRASWIAELAGEWKKTKEGEPLSPLLVDAFTRNLFTDVSVSGPSEHPLDEMTSLLKRASEVQFGKSGFSLKGIARSSKQKG